MYRLFNAAAGFQRINVTHYQAALMTLPVVIAELILLTIFSFVDPPRQVESIEIDGGFAVQRLVCEQETRAFFIVQVIYNGKALSRSPSVNVIDDSSLCCVYVFCSCISADRVCSGDNNARS